MVRSIGAVLSRRARKTIARPFFVQTRDYQYFAVNLCYPQNIRVDLIGPCFGIRGKTYRSLNSDTAAAWRAPWLRSQLTSSTPTSAIDSAVPQFLLLRRREERPLGNTWHGVHGRVSDGETSLEAARRAIRIQTGLSTLDAFSADYINQFFDHATDTIVLAPVFALPASRDAPISLDDEFDDYAWCDRDEATGRLIFAGQRWAVRHIEDVVANPVADSDFYRLP